MEHFERYQKALLSAQEKKGSRGSLSVLSLDSVDSPQGMFSVNATLKAVMEAVESVRFVLAALQRHPHGEQLIQNLHEAHKDCLESEGVEQFIHAIRHDIAKDAATRQILFELSSTLRNQGAFEVLMGVALCIGYPLACMLLSPLMVSPIFLALAIITSCLVVQWVGGGLINRGRNDLGDWYNTQTLLKTLEKEWATEAEMSLHDAPENESKADQAARQRVCFFKSDPGIMTPLRSKVSSAYKTALAQNKVG